MAKPKSLETRTPGVIPEGVPAADPVAAADAAALADAPVTDAPELPQLTEPAPDYVPDQSEVDPKKIPFGQTLMTKQGLVCSEAEDPRRVAQAKALLEGGRNNSRV